MQISEELIRSLVTQVIQEVRGGNVRAGSPAAPAGGNGSKSSVGRFGLFDCADEAVAAARHAFEQLRSRTMEDRKKLHATICAFAPSREGQPSYGEHQGRLIYPWAVVQAIRNSNQFSLKTTADDVAFRTDLYGSVRTHAPVKLVIKREGVFCASIEEERKLKFAEISENKRKKCFIK